jgi:hypothetical protein
MAQPDARAAALRASGDPAFTGSLSVPPQRRGLGVSREDTRAGGTVWGGPRVGVSVYPGGLLLTYISASGRAILASEIEQVRVVGKWWMSRIVIWHHAPHVQDPLFIFTARDGEAARAIRTVLGPQASGLIKIDRPLRDSPPGQ